MEEDQALRFENERAAEKFKIDADWLFPGLAFDGVGGACLSGIRILLNLAW
jgi:hypothetical protein